MDDFIEIQLLPKQESFNSQFTIHSLIENIPFFYDDNYNYLDNMAQSYVMPELRVIDPFTKSFMKILAYIIAVVFFVNIIAGLLLIFYSIKNNTNELVTKKCVTLFQFIFMIPFLLLYRISFPPNLHYFLKKLYQILIQNLESFEFIRGNDDYIFEQEHTHPNFFDRSLHSNYIRNFGSIFIVHFILLVIYSVLFVLDYYFLNLGFQTRRKIKRLKKTFEFNIFIIFILFFQSQIIIFSSLNLSSNTDNSFFSKFSFALSIFYLSNFFFLILAFVYFYFKKHKFYHQSELKYKISFLFIGYKNNNLANIFEISKVFLISCFLITLAVLRNNTFPQIGISYSFYFLFFCLQVCIRPYENKTENYLSSLSEGLFMKVLILMLILGMQDVHQQFDTFKRNLLGWVIVLLIFLIVCIKCISTFFEIYCFRNQIHYSSKLIFFFVQDTNESQNCNIQEEKALSRNKLYANSPKSSKHTIQSYGNLGNLVNQQEKDIKLNITEV